MSELAAFAAWLRAHGIQDEQHLARYRVGAELFLRKAPLGELQPKHVDAVVEEAQRRGAPKSELATLHKIGTALLRYRRELPPLSPPGDAGAPPAPDVAPITEKSAPFSLRFELPQWPRWVWRFIFMSVPALLFLILFASAHRKPGSQNLQHNEKTVGKSSLSEGARAAYDEARGRVLVGDMPSAISAYERAIAEQADFTEAWYNLGAAQMNLAIETAGRNDRAQALALAHQSVNSKQRSKDLADKGTWYVYLSSRDQGQVMNDLRQGLADSDEIAKDEDSLWAALRLYSRR